MDGARLGLDEDEDGRRNTLTDQLAQREDLAVLTAAEDEFLRGGGERLGAELAIRR